MHERRRTVRKVVDMMVKKLFNGDSYFCRACEISPTGIRLQNMWSGLKDGNLVDIEVPLVEGQLTTSISSRCVWRSNDYEAYEFVGPSVAQRAILERLFA